MSDSKLAGQFFDAAIGLLERVRDEEAGSIAAAGAAIAETVAAGGRLFAFGAGHSSLAAQDVVYRAAWAGPDEPARGARHRRRRRHAGLHSARHWSGWTVSRAPCSTPARPGPHDLLVIISLSGRNALPVEMAQNARALGLTVVGVTSVAYTTGTKSRHVSGGFLRDHCDIVLDSKIAIGDAELRTEGVEAPFAPASTVVTSALMQAMMATAAEELVARGIEPPLLRSGNVDGGHEWNGRVMREYGDRVFYRH